MRKATTEGKQSEEEELKMRTSYLSVHVSQKTCLGHTSQPVLPVP